jgi:hypothetical protein
MASLRGAVRNCYRGFGCVVLVNPVGNSPVDRVDGAVVKRERYNFVDLDVPYPEPDFVTSNQDSGKGGEDSR